MSDTRKIRQSIAQYEQDIISTKAEIAELLKTSASLKMIKEAQNHLEYLHKKNDELYDLINNQQEESDWNDNRNEEWNETEYAQENDMDSSHYCWNCKYGDCEIH